MQTAATPSADVPAAVSRAAAASLVVLTTLDGTLRDPRTRSCVRAREALALLAESGIPVVVLAGGQSDEVITLRRELGLRHPFVCEGGAALYVPRGYFPALSGLGEPSDEWDVVRFHQAQDAGQAVRLLISLYKAHADDDVVIVGLGGHWADRALLCEVDVPVIVRNEDVDQGRLARRIPTAYVTKAEGPEGWSEAILGSVCEGT